MIDSGVFEKSSSKPLEKTNQYCKYCGETLYLRGIETYMCLNIDCPRK